MNKYSVRVVVKNQDKETGRWITANIRNILVSATSKQDARKRIRTINSGQYSNLMRYRLGRITQTYTWDEEDGFSIPIKEARLKKHWEE